MPSCCLPFLRVCYPIFSRILCAMNSSPCRSSRRPRCATKAACRLPTSRAPAPIAAERSARPQPAADAPTPAPEAVRVPAVADCHASGSVRSEPDAPFMPPFPCDRAPPTLFSFFPATARPAARCSQGSKFPRSQYKIPSSPRPWPAYRSRHPAARR